jgi:LacI family transcriptional regulator
LIGIGHRRIALVGCHPNAYPSFEDRRRGYLHALSDHGILQPYFADSLSEHAITRQATIQLIREHPEITAIFGVNDDMAIAALNAVQSLGYRVPEDISIIGYDDIALATHVMPALTTVQVDKLQMGRIAVQLLNNRVEYPEAGRMTTVLHTQLIERESTGSKLKDE